MLDPFYLAFVAFGFFVLVTITFSACIRKYRQRRHTGNNRSAFVSESARPDESRHFEMRTYDGNVNLYEAKPNFKYDPELLPLSGSENNSSAPDKPNGLSYLAKLPDDNLSIALEQKFYETYSKN